MGCVCPVFPRANARFRALPHQATRLPGPFAQARTRANKALAMALGGTGLVLVVKCAGAVDRDGTPRDCCNCNKFWLGFGSLASRAERFI